MLNVKNVKIWGGEKRCGSRMQKEKKKRQTHAEVCCMFKRPPYLKHMAMESNTAAMPKKQKSFFKKCKKLNKKREHMGNSCQKTKSQTYWTPKRQLQQCQTYWDNTVKTKIHTKKYMENPDQKQEHMPDAFKKCQTSWTLNPTQGA